MSTLALNNPPADARLRPGISVIIPAYNSERSLRPLVDRLLPVLARVRAHYEVILVNDGSHDRTWEHIQALLLDHDHLVGIHLMRNYGQHGALLCGIRAARYDTIITMDDDLQHPPEELPKLLEALRDDVEVVYGPPLAERHGCWRDLASIITKLALQGAMGAETARNVSALRVFRTRLRDAFANYQSSFVSIDVLLTWGTRRFTAVRVRHDPRTIGRSNYTFRKLTTHALNMMTGFSTLPLQVASFIGFALTLFGFGVLLYVAGRLLVEESVPGFPFLASIIAIFSGAQLFSLGIIGEYLARVHFRLMDRPPYVVHSRAASAQQNHEHRRPA